MDNKSLKKVISLAGSGKKVPVMKLVRDDPEMAAVISKLVSPRFNPNYGTDGNKTITNPDTFSFRNISDKMSENINDSETIMQLLPDMELWAQILIASIISPKDMTTTELTYTPPEALLPSEVSSAMINQIKIHFEQVYRIKPLLPQILKDVLFRTGSYPIAVIPENSLDEIINGVGKITMESISSIVGPGGEIQPKGLLGPKEKPSTSTKTVTGISFESFNFNSKDKLSIDDCHIKLMSHESQVYVTDNTDLLKVPLLNDRIRAQHVATAIGSKAMEGLVKLNDREVAGLVYKNKQASYKHMSVLKTSHQLHRHTIGEPLIIHLTTESVIPVHVPGTPSKQIGFFVLIDADGNPINKSSPEDQYRTLSNRMKGGGSANFPSAMINKVSDMMGTGEGANAFDASNRSHLDYSVKAYSELIEADLLARLRNGVYGNSVALAKNQEVYRIMLARTLEKQNTQLLFIPVELMTYFALRYSDNGIGRSLLDEMKILLSLRIMLMFADVMASVKNSIGRTEVKLKLDEHDPDPKKAIETTIHEIVRTRQQAFPLGVNSPGDVVDWLQRASLEFTFEGHPGLPDVSVEFGEKNTNYTKPDSDLEETLRKRSIMATGLNPETVDAGFGAEFATSILANNVLLTKRVVQIQEEFTPQLTDHVKKCIMGSQPLTDALKTILKENLSNIKERLTDESAKEEDAFIVERIFYDFLNGFEVKLPSPNSVTLENQAIALKTYTDSLDEVIESYISSKFFNDTTGGEVSGDVDTIKEVIRAYFVRKWLNENGMLPELSSITATGEDGKPMVDFFQEQTTHLEALAKSLSGLLIKLQEPKENTSAELEDNGVTQSAAPEQTTEENPEGGGTDDEFGGGDMPSFDEPSTEETPPTDEETPPAEEKKEGEDKTTEETPPE